MTLRLRRHVLAVTAPLVLSACGGLDTPDLAVGEVSGQIEGASPGGYIYIVGHPDLVANLRSDGSATLAGVPAGNAKIVLYDGLDHAEVVEIAVTGARRSALRRDASAMPKAGRIVADARTRDLGPVDAAFEVTDTDGRSTRIRTTKHGAGAVVLFPLPKGEWKLRASHEGHGDKQVAVQVAEGEDVFLQVDLDQ